MSNRAFPANWSIRYFPEKGALPVTLILWAGYFVVVMGSAVATAIVHRGVFREGAYPQSVSAWDWAFPLMRLIAFVIGVLLIGFYLRLHVAHGQTRDGFMSQATVYLVVCSAAFAALTTLGFELERVLYGIRDWSYVVWADQYSYGPNRFPGVYFKVWAEFVMFAVAGMLLTAGFRRFKVVGLLLTIPLTVAMITMTSDAVNSGNFFGPSNELADILRWPAAASVLLALGATWALTRRARI